MPRRIIVSIVSEQTLPNYLFIKQFQDKVDKFIFISTEDMEKKNKSRDIIETAGISEEQKEIIKVDENALYKAVAELNKLNLSNDDFYYVNITGGTKLMAIAVWNYFKRFSQSRFFYVPIGKNTLKEVFDNKEAQEYKFKYKLSVREYLSIYNINIIENKLLFTEVQTEEIFKDVKSGNFDLSHFPKNKLKKFGILDYDNQQIHTKWFEEFLYYRIKRLLDLDDKQIKTDIGLFQKGKEVITGSIITQDNQIDVFFIYNNNPYVIEAKFSVGKAKVNTSTLYQYMYKLAAINNRFGLRTKATIMTLSDFNTLDDNAKKNIKLRTQILNLVYPFDRNQIINEQIFKQNLLTKFVN